MSMLAGLAFMGQGYQQGQLQSAQLALQQMQIKEAQAKLDQMQEALKGRSAAAKALANQMDDQAASGMMPAQQPPMPGQASQPMTPPQPQPQLQPGQSPQLSTPSLFQQPPAGSQSPPGAFQPSPGAGQQTGQGAPPMASQGPQAAAGPMQSQFQILRGIAAKLIQGNPDLKNDPETLMGAIEQTVSLMKGVAPEQKDQLSELTSSLRYNAAIDKIQQEGQIAILKANTAEQVANIRSSVQEQIANLRDTTTRRGQDLTHEDRVMGVKVRLRGQEIQLDSKIAKAAVDSTTAQIKDINSQITELTRTGKDATGVVIPQAQQQISKLQQQRAALVGQLATKYMLGADDLKKVLETDVTEDTGSSSSSSASPQPAVSAGAGAIPPGAPTATGPDGKQVYFNGTAWVPVPAGQ